MAYQDFAFWYDYLNQNADYDALCAEILRIFYAANLRDGIVADLGCGTGEISLRLARAGYDMIAVDGSEEMLSVFRDKLEDHAESGVLLLRQDLAELDLYGTIRAAVSTFDTFNHLPPDKLEKAIQRAALFMEPGGLLVFDANTPYKHEKVLGNECYTIEDDEGLVCLWENRYLKRKIPETQITIKIMENNRPVCREEFCEYCYSLVFWQDLLKKTGLTICAVKDGEDFGPVKETTQRFLIVAEKTL